MYVATDRNAAVMNDINDVELPQRCWKLKRPANYAQAFENSGDTASATQMKLKTKQLGGVRADVGYVSQVCGTAIQ